MHKNSNSIKPLEETENRIVEMENRLDFFLQLSINLPYDPGFSLFDIYQNK